MLYKFTRQELKVRSARQFIEGDCIKVSKYYVWIKYGNYTTPSLLTTVNTEESMCDLPLRKQPYYIKEFKSRLLEECL